MTSQNTASPDELRSLAMGAVAQKDLDTAARILSALVEQQPRSADAWYRLAQVQFDLEEWNLAARCFRKALAIEPKNAQWRQEYAVTLASLSQFAQGIAQHRRAITDGVPNAARSWTEIGRTQQRMRKPDLARAALTKALEIDPNYSRAYECFGRLEVSEGNLEAAETHFRRGMECADDPTVRASNLKRIAGIREKQKDWDSAFEAYQQANLVIFRSPAARFALKREASPLQDDFASEAAAAHYRRWKERAPLADGLPTPSLLVGFPRSGTTMTEQVLAALPNMRTTDEHPFTSAVLAKAATMIARMPEDASKLTYMEKLDRLTPGQVTELRHEYWAEVWKVVGQEAREEGRHILDKHPLRILDLGIVNFLFPDARIVVMIRDPRDCCLSAFFQNLGITPVSVRFMTLETLGEIYAKIMGFWVDVRDKLTTPWMEIRYEDFVADFETHARRLVEFVGEPWDDKVLDFHKRAAKRTIATPSYEAVTQQVNTRAVGKWARYEKHIEPLVERVRPFLETFGYEE